MHADIDAARAALPREGERIIDIDGPDMTVAWCSGWLWPLDEKMPIEFYAQGQLRSGEIVSPEYRVIPARDAEGTRFWLAERRQ